MTTNNPSQLIKAANQSRLLRLALVEDHLETLLSNKTTRTSGLLTKEQVDASAEMFNRVFTMGLDALAAMEAGDQKRAEEQASARPQATGDSK